MTPILLAVLLSVAQDTSAIDRGVRIGIIYRPGVRPGLVMLPRTGMGLDSVRAIVSRDLDYSDRFEVITLPGGDSIRLASPSTDDPLLMRVGYAYQHATDWNKIIGVRA